MVYTLRSALLLVSVAVLSLVGCQNKNKSANEPAAPAAPRSLPTTGPYLKDVAPFPVGVSVIHKLLFTNPDYRGVILREMSSITVENAQKWSGLHPEENRFDFVKADSIVDWAVKNNLRVQGHTLLWYTYNPDWLTNFQGDSLAWENLLKTHIQTVVGHFKGRVASWDVVNEAFMDDGRLRNVEPAPEDTGPLLSRLQAFIKRMRYRQPKKNDGSLWRQHLGPDYVARCFYYAREADPDAVLFYNDYGQERLPAKAKAILAMVADFKRRGVPIDGLGLQMHLGVSEPNEGIRKAIEESAQTGLKVCLTELDILASDWKRDPNLQYTDSLQRKQADKFRFIAETYRTVVPKAQQYGITTWDVSDADSWFTKIGFTDWPLLFDQNYNRKKAYYAFVEGLKK